MSDIFNQESTKSSVAAFLKGKRNEKTNKTDNLKELLNGMVDLVPPANSDYEYKDLYAQLKTNRLKVFRPMEIPELIKVNIEDVLSDEVIRATKSEGAELDLPVGDTSSIPTYRPNHSTTDRLTSVVNSVAYHTASLIQEQDSQADRELLIQDAVDLVNTLNTVVFSTGTLSGQVNRLVKGTAVRNGKDGSHKNKTLAEIGITAEEVLLKMEETLPLSGPPEIPLTSRIQDYIYDEDMAAEMGTDTDIPPINMKSSAGLPYLGKKKRDVTLESIALADNFLGDVSAMLRDNTGNLLDPRGAAGLASTDPQLAAELLSKELTQLVMEKYWYLGCGLLFPKGERYDAATLNTKTRNIWSAPYPTHLLGSMITYPVVKNSLNVLTSTTWTNSLSKLSLTQGGMDQFVNMMRTVKEVTPFVYADNIYVLDPNHQSAEGRGRWLSLDLTKGECNATREFSQVLNTYLLTRGWVDGDGNPLFSFTWAFVAQYVIPLLTVDSMALLKNLLLKNPGQGSGNSQTFVNNHLVSTIFLMVWEKEGKPDLGDPQVLETLMTKSGIDIKIELDNKGILSKLEQAEADTTPISNKRKNRKVVSLDLLGWDATHTEFGFTPVLAKDRLLKSICCPQPPSNRFDSIIKKRLQKYVQTFALFSVGAWCYPGLRSMCEEYTLNYWANAMQAVDNTNEDTFNEDLAEALESDAFSEVVSMINPEKPPHLQDWPEIFYGKKDKPKGTPRNVPRLQRINPDSHSANKISKAMAKYRVTGKLEDNDAYRKIQKLVHAISGESIKEDAAKAHSRKLARAPNVVVYDELLQKMSPRQIGEAWEQALSDTPTNQILKDYPISYGQLQTMRFTAPPPKAQAVTAETYKRVTGQPITGSPSGEHLEDYEMYLKGFNKRGEEALALAEASAAASSHFITNSVALLATVNKAAPVEVAYPRTAKPGERVDNPFVAYKGSRGMPLGTLAKNTKNPQPEVPQVSKTQKRRAQRKRTSQQ
nr:RNA dependent RNA polymerase [Birnavirus TM-2022]